MKLKGAIRLVGIAALIYLLLPLVMVLFGCDNILDAVIGRFPMGSELKNVAERWIEHKNGDFDSLLTWFKDATIVSSERIFFELSQLFFIGVFSLSMEYRFDKVFKVPEGGLLNGLANLLIHFAVFTVATLICDWIFAFFEAQLQRLPGVPQENICWLVSVGVAIGGVLSLLCLGNIVLSSIKCAWKIMAAVLTYLLCCIVAFSSTPPSVTITIAAVFMVIFLLVDGLFSAL